MTAGYLLDTSVVISMAQDRSVTATLEQSAPLPTAISIITEAELRSGLSTVTGQERLGRSMVLERLLAMYEPLPIDRAVVQAYGRVHLAVLETGKRHRGRFADMLIAATALAHDLTLVTENIDDFVGLESLIDLSAGVEEPPPPEVDEGA